MELIRIQLIILFRKYQMHISNAANVMDVNSVNSWFNLYTAGYCEENQGFISELLRPSIWGYFVCSDSKWKNSSEQLMMNRLENPSRKRQDSVKIGSFPVNRLSFGYLIVIWYDPDHFLSFHFERFWLDNELFRLIPYRFREMVQLWFVEISFETKKRQNWN